MIRLALCSSAFLLFFGFQAFATLLPPGQVPAGVELKLAPKTGANGISEAVFNRIVDKVGLRMAPAATAHNLTISLNKRWNNTTPNANSTQFFDHWWKVNIYGGLARRDEMTVDGLTLTVCHEFGHHLGGYPMMSFPGRWAANEGQADYFAAQVCVKKVWEDEVSENAKFRNGVDSFVQSRCDSVWKSENEQNICYRTAAAGMAMASFLRKLMKEMEEKSSFFEKAQPEDPEHYDTPLTFSNPDPKQVKSTFGGHPNSQCRLDTYLRGALCGVPFDLKVIPGRNVFGDQTNHSAIEAASHYSCFEGHPEAIGARPACWFKSNL